MDNEEQIIDIADETFFCKNCGKTFTASDEKGFKNYVEIPNGDDMCRECFKEHVFKYGSDVDWFVGYDLVGCFYNENEIEAHGYVLLEQRLVDSQEKLEKICDELAYISDGGINKPEKVLVQFVKFSVNMDKAIIRIYTK